MSQQMGREEALRELEELRETVSTLRKDVIGLSQRVDDLEFENEQLRDLVDDVPDDLDRTRRDQARLRRRLTVVEDEVGLDHTANTPFDEGESRSRLGRLMREGATAIVANPSPVHERAETLAENWDRWGDVKSTDDGRVHVLATREHDLKTRLEDARTESLQWAQVYRAMELVAEYSDGTVVLEDDGTYGKPQLKTDYGKHLACHVREETDD